MSANQKESPMTEMLSLALLSVQRKADVFTPSTHSDASKILKSLTSPVLSKVFALYKSKLRSDNKFRTAVLYRAPMPQEHLDKTAEDDNQRDASHDAIMNQVELERRVNKRQ